LSKRFRNGLKVKQKNENEEELLSKPDFVAKDLQLERNKAERRRRIHCDTSRSENAIAAQLQILQQKAGFEMSSKPKYKLIITTGPTQESLDPVRFISNHSTGTLGITLAKTAHSRGHSVTLITGPTQQTTPKGVKKIQVKTAQEMETAVTDRFPKADALIMNAAVADFRPVRMQPKKIKRSGADGSVQMWQVELIENPDIVAQAARMRKENQVVVGFALETERLLSNAKRKLTNKNLDAIVATHLPTQNGKEKTPFGASPMTGAILEQQGKPKPFKALSKGRLAARILDSLEALLEKKK
jgi:phosphopantothenoylcysteine decarboxylase / phosphopantothenate---cysteine ligase